MPTPDRLREEAVRWTFFLGIVAAWQVASRNMPTYLVPPPLSVAQDLLHLLGNSGLRHQVLVTLFHIFVSIGISMALAAMVVGVLRFVPVLTQFIEARMTPILNAMPSIGWAILGVIWFGLDTTTVVFAISAMLFPFNLINFLQGIRSLNRDYLEMARSFTDSSLRQFILVGLPMLTPFLFATLRLNFGVAWKIALTAELLGGNAGLGYLMNLAMQAQNTTRILTIAFFIVIFVYLIDVWLFDRVQNRFDALPHQQLAPFRMALQHPLWPGKSNQPLPLPQRLRQPLIMGRIFLEISAIRVNLALDLH